MAAEAKTPSIFYAALSAAVLLAPFVALLAFVFPQSDDFCFGAVYQDHGLWGGLGHFYQAWSGRLLANLLIILPHALADWAPGDVILWTRLFGFLGLSGLVAVSIYCARRFLAPSTKGLAMVFGALGAAVFMANSLDLRELIYWLPGLATYLPAALAITVAWIALLSPAGENPSRRSRPVVAGLLGLVVGLSNAAGAVFLLSLLGGRLAAGWLSPSLGWPRWRDGAALAGATLAGFAVLALAPGNEQRILAMSEGVRGDVLGSLVEGIGSWLATVPVQMVHPGWFGWGLLLALFSSRLRPPRREGAAIDFAIMVAAILITFIAVHFAVGHRLPERALNMLFLPLFWSWSRFALQRGPAALVWVKARLPWAAAGRLRPAALALLLLGPNFLLALWTLGGPAWTYGAQMEARWQDLRRASGAPEIHAVAPLQARPDLLHGFGLSEKAADWPNSCAAPYFDLGGIRLRD